MMWKARKKKIKNEAIIERKKKTLEKQKAAWSSSKWRWIEAGKIEGDSEDELMEALMEALKKKLMEKLREESERKKEGWTMTNWIRQDP
ncbi:unnamed protein product [Blepharisma stoltei]|uniref:Uncharacterized protein n=1 Tax=Blepharisma stoltei TaxID=1481888 RepID=A0AAU9IRY8_9CILI|nr:unnamed protein product [Blepharisma stoltei]